jgi:hypothetical protein
MFLVATMDGYVIFLFFLCVLCDLRGEIFFGGIAYAG